MKTEYTISQIAEKLHITTNKIRFYEKKGLLTPMRESQNRYRKFGEEDIFRLETILLYRSLGLSIEAIQNILQCNKKENYLTHMQNQWMAVNNEIHRLRGTEFHLLINNTVCMIFLHQFRRLILLVF